MGAFEPFLARLTELCAIDSPTRHRPGVDACAHLLARWAEAAGCTVDWTESPDGLHPVIATSGSGRGRVVLLGHHDTVFPLGEAARRPVRIDGDRARGPGVADMKGGLLVALAALERLAADPGGPHGRVELHSLPDEEARNVAPFTLDRLRGATASLCFECGRASGAIVTARKAGTWIDISVRGRAAHAGTEPQAGRSALRALSREIMRIEAELDGTRPGMTANATWLRAGDVKNTIPDRAETCIDIRAGTTADLAWAIERIHAFGDHDGVVFEATDEPGFPALERDDVLADACLRALAAHGAPAIEEVAGGVSDASWASAVGVPSVDGLGPVGALDHTVDEYIELPSVEPRVAATVALCRELGR